MYTYIVLSTDCGLRGINPESFDQNNPKERFPPNKLSSFTKANSSVAHAKIKKNDYRKGTQGITALALLTRYQLALSPLSPNRSLRYEKKRKVGRGGSHKRILGSLSNAGNDP